MTRMISPEIEAEFLRIPDASRFSGIPRSSLYKYMADGSLASKSLRRPGNIRGIRLISKQALRDFINSCEDNPEDRPKPAPKTKMAKHTKKGSEPV